MVISLPMILILLALLIIGIGIQFIPDVSPRAKGWISFALFLIAALVVLFYAGVLR